MKKIILSCLGLLLLSSQAAHAQTEDALWKKFVADPSEENISQLVANYPESALLPKAADLLWGKCKAKGDKNSCELYIQFFSEGEHEQEAFEIISRADGPGDIIEDAGEVVVDIIDAFDDNTSEALPPDLPDAPVCIADPSESGNTEPSPGYSPVPDNPNLAPPARPDPSKPKPRPGSSTRPPSKPGARPNAPRKSATFLEKIRTEHNRVVDKRKGVMMHLKFRVDGFAGKPCVATVYFLDSNGKPLADTNLKYADANGRVASIRKFTPKNAATQYNDFKLFMPYGELHRKGKNKIIFYATIRSGNTVLAKTGKGGFNFTWN